MHVRCQCVARGMIFKLSQTHYNCTTTCIKKSFSVIIVGLMQECATQRMIFILKHRGGPALISLALSLQKL
jgi:hypothetical protein